MEKRDSFLEVLEESVLVKFHKSEECGMDVSFL